MTTSTPPVSFSKPADDADGSAKTTPLHGPEARHAVRKAFSNPLASLVVLVITVIWTVPLVGFFISSFRTKDEVANTGWWQWFGHLGSSTLGNYHSVLSGEGGLALPLVNSLAITIPATIIPIFLASMAAYALAWIKFRGSDFIFFGIFALQVVPLQMALVSLQKYYNSGVQLFGVTVIPNFGLKGTFAEIWVTHTMFSMPLAVFLLHNFIAQLPTSIIEAARVDGANHLRIFRSIVLPLSMPAIASFGIFQFLWVWNDLLVAKVFGGGDASKQPVTARIQDLAGSYGRNQQLLASAGFLAIVIPLIVFLSLQRYFVRGLLAGSVKGLTRTFPDGFRWGSATSAYQIEGAVDVDGRGPSIWDTFTRTPGAIADGTNGDVACDHYHRYREDVALMVDLGLQDYRFSIAWPRIVPAGGGAVNAAGLDFYSQLVDTLLEHGVRPVVTLYHWDLPQPLQELGGWDLRDTAARFADYAAVVGRHLGDRVHMFTTLNEPWCSAFLGYASGDHAPGVRNPAIAFRAAHHLLLGHGLAAAALGTELSAGREVSITLNPANVRAASDSADDVRAARIAELATNQVFLDPLVRGTLNEELVAATAEVTDWSFVHDGDLATIAAPIDTLGVNYYNPHLVGASPRADGSSTPWPGIANAWSQPQGGARTAMGWPVEPASMTELLIELAREYPGIPFAITENGSAWDDVVAADGSVEDRSRAEYLTVHIAAVLDAIEAGVDVRAYYAWSLLDNFEWAWGLAQRFGLIHVDFDSQVRTPKASARVYRDIIAAHGIGADASSLARL